MLIKTAVCEDVSLCEKCGRYHSAKTECWIVTSINEVETVKTDLHNGQSINKDTSNVSE